MSLILGWITKAIKPLMMRKYANSNPDNEESPPLSSSTSPPLPSKGVPENKMKPDAKKTNIPTNKNGLLNNIHPKGEAV